MSEHLVRKPLLLTIQKGATSKDIAETMAAEGLIKSPVFFIFWGRMWRLNKKLKPGDHRFPPGFYDLRSIFEILQEGERGSGLIVTIPPGFTLKEIEAFLKEREVISDSEPFLLKATSWKNPFFIPYGGPEEIFLEGFLYPDTYEFYKHSSTLQVVQRILENFKGKMEGPLSQVKSFEELYSGLILASVIEMESGHSGEKKRISGVFHNRIKKGMPLQSDATLQYAFPTRKERVLLKDLEIDNPYNSYKNLGLTPTPICSPRVDSLEAALNPEEHDFLFFVSTGKGSHVFTKNFKDHQSAKKNYLKKMGWH